MDVAYEEMQALKRIMVQKIQKAHNREVKCNQLMVARERELEIVERELRKVQDQSKKAIDDLMAELKKKDKQLLRMSQAYRQTKDDLAKIRQKLNIKNAEHASMEAEMKRNRSRVASMTESLTIAQSMKEIRKPEVDGFEKHREVLNLSCGDFSICEPKTVEKADSKPGSPSKPDSLRNSYRLYKKFSEKALEWLSDLEPCETPNYMDHCQQIVPFAVNLVPIPPPAIDFLLRVAHQPQDLPSPLKYFHLPKRRESTVQELLLIITICARSPRQKDGGELTDALLTLKAKGLIPKSNHQNIVRTFSYLSSDRCFRKDVIDILIQSEVIEKLSDELLRTLYLATAQDEVYGPKQKPLFEFLVRVCELSKQTRLSLERLGLVTILKRIRLEMSTIPPEIQRLSKVMFSA